MLKFGTSGLRGLSIELTDKECYLYTSAFLKYLLAKNYIKQKSAVAVAGDFRPSSERILKAIAAAIKDCGFKIDYCGIIPTPTVSLYGFKRRIPSIMVTGSHIPYNRNGIKFNLPTGEILKKDEQAITEYYLKISANNSNDYLFNKRGLLKKSIVLPKINLRAKREYIARYLNFFKQNCLRGKKIVVYQNSSVIRDIMVEIFRKLGARVIPVNRSEKFVPIDTEAMRAVDLKNARQWAKKYKPDAVISADGDSDRPVLFDETGNFIRGDFLGIICSAYLKADSVSVTVSCNTALEKSGKFKNINRTKIGSPYVIEAMNRDGARGYKRVVAYEANGGFLTGSDLELNGRRLSALPTRDSILPLVSTLALAGDYRLPISQLTRLFPQRFVYSQSIKGVSTEMSHKILQKISRQSQKVKEYTRKLFGLPAKIRDFNFTDGVRIFLANGEIIHIRPSGNSPEIRVYSEADTLAKARDLTEQTLKKIAQLTE